MDEITHKRPNQNPARSPQQGASMDTARSVNVRQNNVQNRFSPGQRPVLHNEMKTQQFGADRSAMRKDHGSSENAFRSEKTIAILEKIVAVSIFMLFFGLPLFFVNFTYQGIIFEKQYYFYLWTFIGVVAMIARSMMGGKIEIRRTSLDIPLGIFWCTYVLSTIFSVDKYHSFFGFFGNPINGLVSVTALILAYYLVVSYVSKERIMLIWWAIVASGSAVVVWSFLATMRLLPASVYDVIPSTLVGSFSGLAIFLGMMIPMFIMSFSVLGKNTGRSMGARMVAIFLGILTIIDLITLSALYDYVQWYILLFAIGLLLVFAVSRVVHVTQRTTMMTVGAFFFLFVLMIWSQPVIVRTNIQSEASVLPSLSFHIAKEAIKDRPLLGSGPGTFGYNFSLYKSKDLNRLGQYDIRFFSDRGVLFESLSTVGLLGTIALVIVLLTYISTIFHAFVRSQDEEIKIVSLGFFVASAIGILYVLFWSIDGMIVTYAVLLTAVLIGVLRGTLSESVDRKISFSMAAAPQYALSFAFLSILVAAGVIFGFVTLGKMFTADVYAGNALRARAQENFERSSTLFTKAVSLNAREGRYYTVISQYGLDLANRELAKPDGERNDELVKNYVNAAAGASSAGKELMPNDVLANETRGFVFENSGGYISGALSTAMSAYERAGELEPHNPYLDVAQGKLKLVEAQTQGEEAVDEKNAMINEAKEMFIAAKDKTTFTYDGQDLSLFAPAHYYISVVEEALGNIDASIDAMALALQVTGIVGGDEQQVLSRQINYGFNLARLLQVRGTEEDNANAERLLLQIIGINDQEVNSLLNLGLLYERTNRKDKAVEEYKKILALLPEDDEKSRQNIQNLIDTVEQGGSNVDTKNNQTSEQTEAQSDESADDSTNEQANETEASASILFIRSGNGADADKGRSALQARGYAADIRDEDEEISGVMMMYSGAVEGAEIATIESALRDVYPNIEMERNDQEVSIYNHDVVVVVGNE